MRKRIWEIGVIILLNLMLLCMAGDENAQRLFRPSEYVYSMLGDRSGEVEQVQRQLGQLNYYSGEADGFFSLATRSAVKKFQRDNALEQSGEADERTLEALKVKTENPSCLGDTDYELLTKFAAAECAGENPYNTMARVKQLLNTAQSPCAPESIAAVLFQKGRYACVEADFSEIHPDEDCRSCVFLLCG